MKRNKIVRTTLGDLIVALTEEALKVIPQRRQAYPVVASILAGFSLDRGMSSTRGATLKRRRTGPHRRFLADTVARCACLVSVLLLSACTSSFEPRLTASALQQPRLPTAKEIRGGVEVAIEEYLSSHKSRRAFDADLGAKGVLSFLVHIDNKSALEYRLERGSIRGIFNGQRLGNLYGLEAADTGAFRNPTWNALVNTAAMGPLAMFFGVGVIAGSASQTQKINRQIEQHFEQIELTDQIVRASETATGFVFFSMPPGVTSLDTMIFEITLRSEPFEGHPTRPLVYRFTVPTLQSRS